MLTLFENTVKNLPYAAEEQLYAAKTYFPVERKYPCKQIQEIASM